MRNGRSPLAAVAAGLILASAATAADPPPNVLLITVDDMNADLGTFGQGQVRSPNIDRLAARGVRFDRAYCQYPLCNPSRASFLTGQRPDHTRVLDNSDHFRTGQPDIVTLPQLFKNNGYYVARVGKLYHYGNPGQIGTSGLDDPPSWTEFYNPAGRDKTVLEPDIQNDTPSRGLGSSLSWLIDETGDDLDHTDGRVATQAIQLLEAHRDGPFFLAAGFYKPHCPYVAPRKYFDLYPLDTIRLPEIPGVPPALVPEPALASTRPWPYFGVAADRARLNKRAYYATISFVDAQIGRLLDALDRLQLTDRTIVVFLSDHGYHLGEHGLWMKSSCFEESARVPMVIAAPGRKARGAASTQLIELIDLYPTLADLAGLKPPPTIDGATLVPLLDDPAAHRDRPAFTQVQRGGFAGHSVRTHRYRYTEWDGGRQGVELYDHESDPHELTNLAASPAQAPVVADLKKLVKANWPISVTPLGAARKAAAKKQGTAKKARAKPESSP